MLVERSDPSTTVTPRPARDDLAARSARLVVEPFGISADTLTHALSAGSAPYAGSTTSPLPEVSSGYLGGSRPPPPPATRSTQVFDTAAVQDEYVARLGERGCAALFAEAETSFVPVARSWVTVHEGVGSDAVERGWARAVGAASTP